MAENTLDTPQLPPHAVAFIIDGEVVQTLHCDERLAAILTSDPVIVPFDSSLEYALQPKPGYTWDGTTFIEPESTE